MESGRQFAAAIAGFRYATARQPCCLLLTTMAIPLKSDPIATYQDLIDLPPRLTGELIHGVLHAMPRPKARHLRAEMRLGRYLGNPFEDGIGGPGGWIILIEPELHLVRDTLVLVPDLAGWRKERMPDLPDDHRFTVTPDWICEILSPTTQRYDRDEKMPIYAEHGVAWAWLVDPEATTLEVWTNAQGHWQAHQHFAADPIVDAEPFSPYQFNLFA